MAVAPVAVLAPPTVSPLVQKLRTDWRWAGISQFLWTFSDAFGLVDWDIEVSHAHLCVHALPHVSRVQANVWSTPYSRDGDMRSRLVPVRRPSPR